MPRDSAGVLEPSGKFRADEVHTGIPPTFGLNRAASNHVLMANLSTVLNRQLLAPRVSGQFSEIHAADLGVM